jgi:hypothetical protein
MTKALKAVASLGDALTEAKRSASFTGPMRFNLLALLDAILVPAPFGRTCAAEFFESEAGAHLTSALRYPLYVDSRNCSGPPNVLRHPPLANMIDRYLAEDAARIKNEI